jgi:hypothetical protein
MGKEKKMKPKNKSENACCLSTYFVVVICHYSLESFICAFQFILQVFYFCLVQTSVVCSLIFLKRGREKKGVRDREYCSCSASCFIPYRVLCSIVSFSKSISQRCYLVLEVFLDCRVVAVQSFKL